MADYLWPAGVAPRTSEFWPRNNVPTFTSPYTQTMTVVDTGVPVWVCSMTFVLHKQKAWALDAFLAKLRGKVNRALLWNWHKQRPLSGDHEGWADTQVGQPWSDGSWWVNGDGEEAGWIATGRPTIVTAAAVKGATSIVVDGLAPLAVYHAGEEFGLSHGGVGRVYRLLDDVTADANGAGTLTFWPELRGSVADEDPVDLERPTAPFRLVNADDLRNRGNASHVHEYELTFVEDLTDLA